MQIKFEWTPDISVGNEEIDNQHKKLLEKINELLDAIMERKDNDIVGGIISFLGDYINDHLIYEENYMKEHLYPEISHHREIHQHFINKYLDFQKRFNESGPSSNMLHEVETFLGDWWIHHIGIEDKKYAIFIKENE